MSITYIQHAGRQIMFADYQACKKEEEQLELLEQVAIEIAKSPFPTLLLVSYEGVSGGIKYMSRLKELGNTVFKKHMKCSAVLGIMGLKRYFSMATTRPPAQRMCMPLTPSWKPSNG
jgi:hypothetical protein